MSPYLDDPDLNKINEKTQSIARKWSKLNTLSLCEINYIKVYQILIIFKNMKRKFTIIINWQWLWNFQKCFQAANKVYKEIVNKKSAFVGFVFWVCFRQKHNEKYTNVNSFRNFANFWALFQKLINLEPWKSRIVSFRGIQVTLDQLDVDSLTNLHKC